eukprot:maker-scaffold380_size190731-snap-gene-0.41 protein:Tk02447 transcript:maker-scaffold380_size190731-snap-gene-0.41-mRNA-1 annotation:"hypothetical protein BRAFLDRAFT_76741"
MATAKDSVQRVREQEGAHFRTLGLVASEENGGYSMNQILSASGFVETKYFKDLFKQSTPQSCSLLEETPLPVSYWSLTQWSQEVMWGVAGGSIRSAWACISRGGMATYPKKPEVRLGSQEFYVRTEEPAVENRQNGRAHSELAVLQFRMESEDTINMFRTYVPPPAEGKGLAKLLARAAFDHCLEHDLKIKLNCSYLVDYLQKNPNPEIEKRVIWE